MSEAIAALCTLVLACFPGQQCDRSGAAAWSDQTRLVIPGCPLSIAAPSARLTLLISANGTIEVRDSYGTSLATDVKPVEPPSMVSWAPDSKEFFVNDGQGSGMSSVFRLFRISGQTVSENSAAQERAVQVFRRQKDCHNQGHDPSVWGLGWSPDSADVYLLVQAAANDPCGRIGSFIGVTVSAKDGRIVEVLSETGTRLRFRRFLPAAILQSK